MSSSDLVARFWRHFRATGQADLQAARELASLAAAGDGGAVEASRALFADVVEPLGDAFGVPEAHAFVDLLCEVVEAVRDHPELAALTRDAGPIGLAGLERGHRLVQPPLPACVGDARLFVLLSRVTLGAEIQMATPIAAALLARDSAARIVLLGPAAAAGIFAGEPRVTVRPTHYPRRGDLVAKLRSSLLVRDAVAREVAGLAPDDWLLIDPDSRLSQSGLLPPAPDERTRFFPSRTLELPGVDRLGQLAGRWAQTLTDAADPPLPRMWLTEGARGWANAMRRQLAADRTRWAVVNFGVGGNASKSLGQGFEEALLRRLAADGFGILLSRGVDEAEVAATARLTERLAGSGVDVVDLAVGADPSTLKAPGRRQIVTWQTDLNGAGALTAAADVYVGYDSSGQHVAAAVGTPGVTAFVGGANERFMRRWSPWGAGQAQIVPATADVDQHAAVQAVTTAVDALP